MSVDYSRITPYFHNYVKLVDSPQSLQEAFKQESYMFLELLQSISATKSEYRYAEDKWSIKDVLQHIIDAERIFAYRALRIARQDKTPLASFDENSYAIAAAADKRSWEGLVNEFVCVRQSSDMLFRHFSEEDLEREGQASNAICYVRGIGYIILGHTRHHANILETRYLL